MWNEIVAARYNTADGAKKRVLGPQASIASTPTIFFPDPARIKRRRR